ncbi:MAG: preprotein translocase subunit SecA [Bacteroidetes bacterium]|nr:MAG: preprotein translocase subunit SecA [Bacteroidota bacterium]PIE88512.1 MAG: preprotein translocase subunit SecA [Bacteroidota bacterium]
MANFLKNLFGTKSQRDIKSILPYTKNVAKLYPSIQKLSHDELRGKTLEFKKRIAEATQEIDQRIASLKSQVAEEHEMMPDKKEEIYNQIDNLDKERYNKVQKVLDEILPEAFAVIKSTAERFTQNEEIEVTATPYDRDLSAESEHIEIRDDKAIYHNRWMAGGNLTEWNMIHYDVQLIGGVVLHQGKIAEMATGEGKTLVATLPVYLNALSGDGVHVVTVNDYLAKRDSEWMGVLYQFHGLSVDCIDKHKPNSEARRKAYNCDITFGTNNEFGFDYLRDNMTGDPNELVQRKHNFAIVDEVDSVLVDDARTPLIISGPTPKGEDQEFDEYKPLVEKLYNNQRTLVTKILAEAKHILHNNPSPEEEKKGAELLFRAYRGLPKNKALIKFLSEPGMKALMQKTENFYLGEQGKHMHIIDDELFFVIDEKVNSIDPTEKGIELMNRMVNDEAFYYIPDVGAEIANLEKEDLPAEEMTQKKNELLNEFSLKSERVHTVNQLLKAYALFERDVEYVIMDNKVKIVDEQTGRIMEGRRYSDGLHQAIEAKENVKVEAATQTYATITLQNYFRMYSKLSGMTGTAETEAGEFWDIYELDVVVIPTNKPIARDDREDLVYKTKREKFNAVGNEIEKLVAEKRPVLVGTTSVETSELLSRMLKRKRIDHNVLNAKLHAREADIVRDAGQPGVVTIATNMAGRGTDIKLGEGVKEAGGLAIIGTERHDSRRVDRQLRGRAGRQGDPGSSQFYVSLEDDLMRMFGSERIAKVMDRLGLQEGEEIQHSMITSSIERAQKKVEENNFGVRKRLLEYDDVMNSQRDVIYKKRRHALFGERLSVDLANMIYDTIEATIVEYQDSRDPEGFRMEMLAALNADIRVEDKEFLGKDSAKFADTIFENLYKTYTEKQARIAERAYPIIKNVVENHPHYENIAIPITDGRRTRNVVANLQRSYENPQKEIPLAIEKSIILSYIDEAWKDHLRELDDLKQSVQNASYEQKDPLLIYKFESFNLFKAMVQKINKSAVSFLIKGNLPMADPTVREAQQPKSLSKQQLKAERNDLLSKAHSNTQQKEKTQPIKVGKKVGRNDPCPCGSGKKYKACHGRPEAEPLN